ncbi:hypothetical protein M3Y97_01117400 [Aphelenchoides bicaudatus]|nr:hypothetical protein M3Y97_01117400 [Aphelenchoides bicaudatus]
MLKSTSFKNRFVPLMSNMKFYTLAYLIFMVAIILGGVIPMHAQVLTADQIRRGIRDVDPKVYEFLSKERTVFGFNADDGNEHYLIGVVSVCIVVAAFFGFLTYCTVSTYVYISKNKTTLHANTARLYTKLLNLLLMDVCIAVLMFFLPSLMFIIAQTFQFECLTSIATICLIVVIFNSLSTNFLILLYIRPYRHEFVSVMQLTLFNLSGKTTWKAVDDKKTVSIFSKLRIVFDCFESLIV